MNSAAADTSIRGTEYQRSCVRLVTIHKKEEVFLEGSKGLHKQSQFLSCRTKTIRISTPELKWDFKYLSPCIKELISFSTRRALNRATIS